MAASREPRLVVAIMGADHVDCLKLCVESVQDVADHIFYLDGGSKDESFVWANSHARILNGEGSSRPGEGKMYVAQSQFDHVDKGGNGKQRNIYLTYLKKYFMNDWCLALDADELVDQPQNIQHVIAQASTLMHEKKVTDCLLSPHMRHFVWNFACEDATVPRHHCPNRLFKITPDLWYPETEHPALQSKKDSIQEKILGFTIWHLAYVLGVFGVNKRYDNHVRKSDSHTPDFLEWWYHAHLFGGYPTKPVPYFELPAVLKRRFGINEDFLYFGMRMQVELKHYQMVKQWKDYFDLGRHEEDIVIDVGCGAGHFMLAWDHAGMTTIGLDKSAWIVKHAPHKLEHGEMQQQDITEPLKDDLIIGTGSLVTCLDILEHLPYDKLDAALENVKRLGRDGADYLFSIPYEGDPNLLADHTHTIKESKEWWMNKLKEHGFRIEATPKDWLYAPQLTIACLGEPESDAAEIGAIQTITYHNGIGDARDTLVPEMQPLLKDVLDRHKGHTDCCVYADWSKKKGDKLQ